MNQQFILSKHNKDADVHVNRYICRSLIYCMDPPVWRMYSVHCSNGRLYRTSMQARNVKILRDTNIQTDGVIEHYMGRHYSFQEGSQILWSPSLIPISANCCWDTGTDQLVSCWLPPWAGTYAYCTPPSFRRSDRQIVSLCAAI